MPRDRHRPILQLAGHRREKGALPGEVTQAIADVSRWCLVTAIAALGMKTSFKELAVVGWRPVALIVAETGWIALLVLGALFFVL